MVCMVILTIQLLGWCWPGGIPFHYTLSVVSVPRVFGSGPFPPLGDISKIALVNELRNFRTVTQCGYGQNDHSIKAMLKSEQRYSANEKLRSPLKTISS